MKRTISVLIFLLLIICIGSACGMKISEELARRKAVDRFENYCRSFNIEVDRFEGPKRVRLRDPGYVFEWVASEGVSEPVHVEVWVSASGWKVEVGVGRGIEQLEGR